MKKNILLLSNCSTRGNTGGLTGKFVDMLRLNSDLINIDILDISFVKKSNPEVFHANRCFSVSYNAVIWLFLKLPRFRRFAREYYVKKTMEKLFKTTTYNLLVIYELPIYVDSLVTTAHKNNTKVLLYPWGSDILRANRYKIGRIGKAIKESDYIGGYRNSGTINYILQNFLFDKEKISLFSVVVPGIREIEHLENKYSRLEMSQELNISLSEMNIVCGYNGVEGQRHREIIESICKIKDKLPEGYQLIFPITYGNSQDYYQELKDLCHDYQLRAVFLENFLTSKQMAFLHLVTDLFINVQPTDNGNAFLMEALSANNIVIVGKWLNYPQFEQYGVPYYQCETLDHLHLDIESVINGNFNSKVPEELIHELRSHTQEKLKKEWSIFINYKI